MRKIQNAVKNGKGLMPPTNLSADDIRDIIAYVTQTFKPSTAEQGNTLTLFEARWSFQRESFKKSLKEVLDKRVKSYEIL